MQLVQIGEVRQKTVLDMVQEMAMRQLAEIEQLKSQALGRKRVRSVSFGRKRCSSAK